MASDRPKPSEVEIIAAAMVHCGLQGVCIPLLVAFLNSRRGPGKWLKGYVMSVNALGLVQTALQMEQAFSVLRRHAPRAPLVLVYPLLTVILGASVQGFFIFRCWCILRRQWSLILPFVLLHMAAVGSGTAMAIYSMKSLKMNVGHKANAAFSVWIICVFLLDLSMTATTIAYIYRSRTGHDEHEHVLNTIWQVTWASAAPPFLLMVAVIVEGHIGDGLAHPGAIFLSDMTGKLFILSLMITLVGRGHIRQKLEQVSKHVNISNLRGQRTTILSPPVFANRDTSLNGLGPMAHFSSPLTSTASHESSAHNERLNKDQVP
ncbi:hypothetical protein FRC12_014177 [Ceratobasidium sp. 428]|nr:hypothetical protein FRC12_014177 [Ceratobasidium sp. 428]